LPRIYNFFRFRVGEGMEAEDLTAATVEKAWRSRQQYQSSRAAISTWLFTIARRVAIDYYRKRRPEIGLAAVVDQVGDESPEATAEHHLDQARASLLLSLASRNEASHEHDDGHSGLCIAADSRVKLVRMEGVASTAGLTPVEPSDGSD
jgi:RNA polymerase sigma factor (sigma-70 family)